MPEFDDEGKKYYNCQGRLTNKGLTLGFMETKAYAHYRINLFKDHKIFVVAIYDKKKNETIREEFNYLCNARKHYDFAEAWIIKK